MRSGWLLLLVVGCGFAPQNAASDATAGSDADAAVMTDGAGMDVRDDDGARRKPITIHASTGNQTDFPVWIDLADAEIAARARADGADIFFTAANGMPLDYELQRWAPGAPRLQAWVRVPTLAHTDLTIYVEYGDLAKATPPNAAGVFRSNFVAVWHLDDTLASTTIADTTGTHPGTATALAPTAQVPAKLGGGVAFDGGGTAQIAFTNPLTGNTPHTISAWVNQAQTTHTSSIVMMGTGGTDQSRFLYGHYGSGTAIGVGQYNDDWSSAEDIEGAGWVLLHWVHEGNNKKTHVYRDGVEIANSPHMLSSAPATAGTTGLIGNAPAPSYGAANGMDGMIDELRIATVVRDAAWIATEYANQNTPNTFYSVGAEQPVP